MELRPNGGTEAGGVGKSADQPRKVAVATGQGLHLAAVEGVEVGRRRTRSGGGARWKKVVPPWRRAWAAESPDATSSNGSC
ncbi:hypothetical protein E2562_029026 [Oryza meyeriana var. granulata]|uniref:DUF834 domain-containing protein n=1 Tax=Oryza meyeriana var. granulata TaxID=110450 RepID=A0A6G1E3X4_9ORYZ|nr:hypothetical protein E2562_029026 [Oryza meyeriana var. granulata]